MISMSGTGRWSGAGAAFALVLAIAPLRAEGDAQELWLRCLGDHVIELCSDSLASKPAAGEEAKPPTFEAVTAACTAERGAFVEMVRARNLAAGRTAAYAERRVVRHTRRFEALNRDLFDKCFETTP